ncbi:MAG: hypothetical protein FVQ76_13935 [Nitrospira sp.]|nr:hypothetical protein [Nitrospira sp.]
MHAAQRGNGSRKARTRLTGPGFDALTPVHWTDGHVSPCHSFRNNAVRLQLHALSYNLGNFLRTPALPEAVEHWSLTPLKDKLLKIGAKVLRHGRYVTLRLAEVAIPRAPFAEILHLIDRLRPARSLVYARISPAYLAARRFFAGGNFGRQVFRRIHKRGYALEQIVPKPATTRGNTTRPPCHRDRTACRPV